MAGDLAVSGAANAAADKVRRVVGTGLRKPAPKHRVAACPDIPGLVRARASNTFKRRVSTAAPLGGAGATAACLVAAA